VSYKFKGIISYIVAIIMAIRILMAWERYYGTDYDDYCYSVCEDINYAGGYCLGGTTKYSTNNFDAYLLSIDPVGGIEWAKNYGTSNLREIVYSIQQTSDGGFIAAGEVWPLHPVNEQWSWPYLVKTTGDGTEEWSNYGGGGVLVQRESDKTGVGFKVENRL
jgi:hypothetical protein